MYRNSFKKNADFLNHRIVNVIYFMELMKYYKTII